MTTPRPAIAPSLILGLIVATPWGASGQVASPTGPRPPATVAAAPRSARPTPTEIAIEGPAKAAIRVEGAASPGLRIKLDGSASSGGKVWYRWLQTDGSRVVLEGRNGSVAQFTVPMDGTRLGFVLVVGDATGVDVKSVQLDVEDPSRTSDEQNLKGDAGDDQAAKVGRRVALNGTRSEPKGRLGFRWIQTAGPKVPLRGGDGVAASFVPLVPGTYQFALIVASQSGTIAEPDPVTVQVSGSARASADPGDASGQAIDELARNLLVGIDGGTRYSEDLAKVFDGVADRIASYSSYSDAIGEMTRRLEPIIPRDKERRASWVEHLFSPLMARLAAGMRPEGLDLALPAEQIREMSKPERSKLAEQLRYTAAGFRATRAMR